MFAIAEALTKWVAENKVQQLTDIKSISKDFYKVSKNYVVVFEPFLQNSYFHKPGSITNLITNQKIHKMDARFPEFILDSINKTHLDRKEHGGWDIAKSCSECIEDDMLFTISVLDDRFYSKIFDRRQNIFIAFAPFMRNAKNFSGFVLSQNTYVVITKDVFVVRIGGGKFIYIQKPHEDINACIIFAIEEKSIMLKYLYKGVIHKLLHEI